MPDKAIMTHPPDVGQRIRALRDQQGLSLRALAERCGMSINAINRIERGENSPTVASLHLLATALEVPITEFFRTAEKRKTVMVKRESRVHAQQQGMDIESLGTGLHNQQIEPFLVTVPPGSGTGSPTITHQGQELVYCVAGALEYQVSDEVYTLTAGDSLLFEAVQPHVFRNLSELPAVILLVFHIQDGSPGHLHT
jgi:transcriptional regulator with XRE-family HTH domain